MGQATILVVEDNESSLDMLQRRLTRAGYSVITATDGEQALTIARTDPPDIVLMDKRLPRLDGLSAVRRMRSDQRTRDIPVICLTADCTVDVQQAAFAAGCQDFLTKPVEFTLLLTAISNLLDGSRAN